MPYQAGKDFHNGYYPSTVALQVAENSPLHVYYYVEQAGTGVTGSPRSDGTLSWTMVDSDWG